MALAPLVILLALVLLYLTMKSKAKQPVKISVIILLSAVIFQAVPYYYTISAQQNSSYAIEKLEYAAKFTLIPYHKGLLYSDIGSRCFLEKDGKNALKYFEKAQRYGNFYNDNFAPLHFLYLANNQEDKALDIALKVGSTYQAGVSYILKNDYPNALLMLDKYIKTYGESINACKTRAIIYKNLNENELAQKDYKKAIELAKANNCKERIADIDRDFKNYKTSISDYYKKLSAQYGF